MFILALIVPTITAIMFINPLHVGVELLCKYRRVGCAVWTVGDSRKVGLFACLGCNLSTRKGECVGSRTLQVA